jgi:hypothetical protein
MLVTMRNTRKGAPDGINTQTYFEGHQYEVHGELLDIFLRGGWCEAAEPFRKGADDGAPSAGGAAEGPVAVVSNAGPVGEGATVQGGESTDESQEGEAAEGSQTGGESGSEGTKEPELILAEADVLGKYTRDELLDLAEEQEIEVPADVVKKADVVKFLAGKLKVTVEQE